VNPNTNRIILSRDVKWLSKRYGEEKNVKPSFVVPTKWDDISNDDEKENDEETIKESEDEEEIMTLTQIGPPIDSRREIQRLDIGQQIIPGRTRQQTRDATQLVEENLDDFYQDCALMSAIVTGQNNEPKTFQEAWYYDYQEKQKKWRTVIWKEFHDMIKQGVWVNVDRSSIPEG